MNLVLRTLTLSDEKAFLEGLQEWSLADREWYTFDWSDDISFEDMLLISNNKSEGIGLLDDRVPATMLYDFVGSTIVGRLNIRHSLNKELTIYGGHIGYAVIEKYRNLGYATEMLRQALKICSWLDIPKVLLTCDDNNLHSIKVIEKFNAELETKYWDEELQRTTRRYWIPMEI
jgi:predicted acetyltransferase